MKKLKKAKMRLNIIIFFLLICLFVCFIWMSAVSRIKKQDNDINNLNLKFDSHTISIEVVDELLLYNTLENGVHSNITFTDTNTNNAVICGFITNEQNIAIYKSINEQTEVGYQMYLSYEDLGNSKFYYLGSMINGEIMMVLSSPSIESIEKVFGGIVLTVDNNIYQFATPLNKLIETINNTLYNNIDSEFTENTDDYTSNNLDEDIDNLYESNSFDTEVNVNGIGDNHMGYYLNTDKTVVSQIINEYNYADCVTYSHLFTDYACTSCQYVYTINNEPAYMYKLEGIFAEEFFNICTTNEINNKLSNVENFTIVNITDTTIVATCNINNKSVYFVTSKDTKSNNSFATYFIFEPVEYDNYYVNLLSNYIYSMEDWTGYIL